MLLYIREKRSRYAKTETTKKQNNTNKKERGRHRIKEGVHCIKHKENMENGYFVTQC